MKHPWLICIQVCQLKKKGTVEKKEEIEPVTFQWKETVRIMNIQKVVTTLAQNKSDEIIMIT
jgi:hypothetical protein